MVFSDTRQTCLWKFWVKWAKLIEKWIFLKSDQNGVWKKQKQCQKVNPVGGTVLAKNGQKKTQNDKKSKNGLDRGYAMW